MMMNKDAQVTIGDLTKLALPLNTKSIGSGDQRNRIVNWVVVLTDWNAISNQVQMGDVVLVPNTMQQDLSDDEVITGLNKLAGLAISATAFFQQVTEEVAEVIEQLELPVFILPGDTDMRTTHRTITALLLDRQTRLTERGMQLYRDLSEMSREDHGLQAMTDMMSKVTGKIVVVQDKRLEIQAMSIPSHNKLEINMVTNALNQREELPIVLRNRKQAAKTRQSYWQQLLPVENIGRLVSPIVSGDRARGYLSVIGPADDLDMMDQLTTEHGAAACALEMAKAKAVSEAKKELRGDFLEGILAGTVPRAEMERLRVRLDHDTDQPHAVVTFAWERDNAPAVRYLETAVNWMLSSHNRPALVHIYGGSTVCMFQALRNTDDDINSAKELEKRLRDYIKAEYPEAKMISGLAGPVETLSEWPNIYQQAVQAMKLAQRLGLNELVEYNSLGVYQLLTQLDDIPTVQHFCDQVIGPLANYDQRHRSNLVETIEAYFEHHGNISQTAESLFIHRNTLLYRLERIKDLTGHDLGQADMRLSLHLALKLWKLRPKG